MTVRGFFWLLYPFSARLSLRREMPSRWAVDVRAAFDIPQERLLRILSVSHSGIVRIEDCLLGLVSRWQRFADRILMGPKRVSVPISGLHSGCNLCSYDAVSGGRPGQSSVDSCAHT